jgi:GNAT superfamily N-acetyltransferase
MTRGAIEGGRGLTVTAASEEDAALRDLRTSRVLVARRGAEIVGTARLEAKKPWAIDVAYFTPVAQPVYLHDLAVDPAAQGRGVGRRLVEAAEALARRWPSDAIRLDAYDHAAGAGAFYLACGFREVGRVSYRGTPLVYFERVLRGGDAPNSACSSSTRLRPVTASSRLPRPLPAPAPPFAAAAPSSNTRQPSRASSAV